MSRRSCRRNLIRVRLHRSYTMRELAETLDVHVRTVQGWHKEGMSAIDEQTRPFLFLGKTIRSFLKNRRQKRRTTLGPNEIYCLRCAIGVIPLPERVSIDVTDRRLGHCSKLVVVRAECPHCCGTVVRFASLQSICESVWWTRLQQAQERLSGTSIPYCNTDSKQG